MSSELLRQEIKSLEQTLSVLKSSLRHQLKSEQRHVPFEQKACHKERFAYYNRVYNDILNLVSLTDIYVRIVWEEDGTVIVTGHKGQKCILIIPKSYPIGKERVRAIFNDQMSQLDNILEVSLLFTS